MDIILLSCSGTKQFGGIRKYENQYSITSQMNPNTTQKLIQLRQEMAKFISEPPGPDIGYMQKIKTIKYMPAIQRYSGIVYQRSNIANSLKKTKNLKIIIISAFYGIVDGQELIRNYNWQMGNKLPNGNITKTWWKHNGLGEILLEIVHKIKPKRVYDFLFEKYRASILPFYKGFEKSKLIRYESQQGFAALSYTGEELAKVLKKYI